ncbi:MAG: bifunctional oligoribonuclease/PAP phosphatase NrnA [Candidatus Andersenbacteria bacterium]|nr:bifunctional oligoribonuclease/PAP phosphatase NrnA [Candidatus Andersenbacteria bacterium]
MKSKTPGTNLLEPYRETALDIAAKLRASKRVLIGTHEHPDGDALGSTLALLHVLAIQGKQVTAYIPDSPPDFFSFLPAFEKLTTQKPDVASFDTVVLLDYTQLYRTHLEAEAKAHPNTIAIDHHHDNLQETNIHLIVPEAAATAQILYELFQDTNTPITKDVATCLLTGIFTDTGSFMHDSVTPDILEIASFLMGRGARLSHIAHETYQKKNLAALHIWGRAFSRIMLSKETGAATSIITYKDLQECGATLDDLSGAVNMLNTLPDTKFAMLLVEFEPGKIKGSLRSEPQKGTDVSKIAHRLGGGGHVLAAGFEVPGTFVQQDGKWHINPTI